MTRRPSIQTIAIAIVVTSLVLPRMCQSSGPGIPAAPPSDQGFGIESRTPWTSSHVHGTPEPPPPYRAERAFPNLTFKNPTVIASAPGSDRLFVAEQAAKIYSFPNDPDCKRPDLFLDLPKEVRTIEPGTPAKTVGDCYGLVFHPQFERNRTCYVCYVVNSGVPDKPLADGTRVSRFTVTATDPPRCDPASEEIIITWLAGGHNGGCLEFGPDGYLYISTGDATSPNPPDGLDAGQDMTRLLSGILRIDVDHRDGSRPYSVPADNPFVELEGARPEKWAYGFRNPWKFSFDRASGDLWVGDVGWELWEMVHRVERGGNYGWSIMEGPQPVKPEGARGPTAIQLPTIALPHSEAASVTGGYVYRGDRLKELRGAYVFGDWETRRMWAARWDGSKIVSREELVEPTVRIVAFGEDRAGELLILDYDDGTIHQLVRNDVSSTAAAFPRTLGQSGLFESVADQRPAPGVIPFSINAEMWADHATAERWVALPGRSSVTVHPSAVPVAGTIMRTRLGWPADAVLAKTISIEMTCGQPETRRRIETQILHYDGKTWRAYSYRWKEDQRDAELVPAEGRDETFVVRDADHPGGQRQFTYNFAARTTCMRCHNPWAQHTLAFNLSQIDRNQRVGDASFNQVRTLEHIGVLVRETAAKNEPAEFERESLALVNPYDPSAVLTERARSYLQVNCAHCHQMGAGGTAEIDVRNALALDRTKTVGVRPTQGTFGIPDAHIVSPGDPYRSVLYYRISKLGGGRMPHLGSDLVDVRGVQLIHDWISALPSADSTRPAAERARASTRSRAKNPSDWVAQELSNTSTALLLADEIGQNKWPAAERDQVLRAASASTEPQIRDLFERFLPDDQRVRRLGSVIHADQLLARHGDAARGRELFLNTPGIACKNCHRIGESGSTLGPELTHIATRYNKPQILESILEPSKVIDPKYVTHLVETEQGRVLTGLLVEKTAEAVVLRDAQDQTIRIPAAQVVQCVPQRQSLMPDLLLRDMTAQQVADLLEFLAGLK
jgi:putative heme-binding domain-containing protein